MDRQISDRQRRSHWWKIVLLLCLIALPIAIFYLILLRTAVNLPILDDYQNILGVAIALKSAHSLADRLAVVLMSHDNGYKLVFESALVWLQYSLLGRIQILPLVIIGNAFPILIFSLVVAIARNLAVDPAMRLLHLLPVACILFQLQYASALNFASISLQQLAVVAFSLLIIYWLCSDSRNTFLLACVVLAVAVAASPNAFFLAPVGVLILVQQRRWVRMTGWIAMHAGLLAMYLYRYAGASAPHTAPPPRNITMQACFMRSPSSALPAQVTPALCQAFSWERRC